MSRSRWVTSPRGRAFFALLKLAISFFSTLAVFIMICELAPPSSRPAQWWQETKESVVFLHTPHRTEAANCRRLLVGECTAALFPGDCPRITNQVPIGSMGFYDSLAYTIRQDAAKYSPDNILLCYGLALLRRNYSDAAIQGETEMLVELLQKQYPKASITVLHPQEVRRVALLSPKYSKDGYHLTPLGFRMLLRENDKLSPFVISSQNIR